MKKTVGEIQTTEKAGRTAPLCMLYKLVKELVQSTYEARVVNGSRIDLSYSALARRTNTILEEHECDARVDPSDVGRALSKQITLHAIGGRNVLCQC